MLRPIELFPVCTTTDRMGGIREAGRGQPDGNESWCVIPQDDVKRMLPGEGGRVFERPEAPCLRLFLGWLVSPGACFPLPGSCLGKCTPLWWRVRERTNERRSFYLSVCVGKVRRLVPVSVSVGPGRNPVGALQPGWHGPAQSSEPAVSVACGWGLKGT